MGRIIDSMRGHRVLVDLLADTVGHVATDHIGIAHFNPGPHPEIVTEHMDNASNTFYRVVYDGSGELISIKAYNRVMFFFIEYYPTDHTLYEPPVEGMPDIVALVGHSHPHPVAELEAYIYTTDKEDEEDLGAEYIEDTTPFAETPPPGCCGGFLTPRDLSFSFSDDECA